MVDATDSSDLHLRLRAPGRGASLPAAAALGEERAGRARAGGGMGRIGGESRVFWGRMVGVDRYD